MVWRRLTVVFFVEPTARALGREGERFLGHVAVRQRLVAILVVAATTTAAAGAGLYWIDSDGLRPAWMTSGGIGFTVGAIAGILAFLIPGIAFRPTIARLAALASGRGTTDPIDARFRRWSLVQAGLLVLAIGAMATARYLP